MKVTAPSDCGNAPRKAILRDFTISLVTGDHHGVGDGVADDVSWEIVGGRNIAGREALLADLERFKEGSATELQIQNIITHGRTAAVDYTVVGSDGRRVDCCDVYTFRGTAKTAKIGAIRSFRVQP